MFAFDGEIVRIASLVGLISIGDFSFHDEAGPRWKDDAWREVASVNGS